MSARRLLAPSQVAGFTLAEVLVVLIVAALLWGAFGPDYLVYTVNAAIPTALAGLGLLVLVDRNAGLSQMALARALGIDRSTVVGVIDKLETRGLVERASHPKDRRAHALRLSPPGAKRFRDLARRVRSHESRIAKRLSAPERELLIALLQRIG